MTWRVKKLDGSLGLLTTLLGIVARHQEDNLTTFVIKFSIDVELGTEHTLVTILHWLDITNDKLEVTLWNLTSKCIAIKGKFCLVLLDVITHYIEVGLVVTAQMYTGCLGVSQTVDNLVEIFLLVFAQFNLLLSTIHHTIEFTLLESLTALTSLCNELHNVVIDLGINFNSLETPGIFVNLLNGLLVCGYDILELASKNFAGVHLGGLNLSHSRISIHSLSFVCLNTYIM